MFPYRRGNQRKRSKGNPQRRAKGGARRLPGSARELLPLLQPTTKALAQVLAGNAKASGQFVHARNVVERADQLIAEHQVERLGVREREEFLEQLARLKLTVSDAEAELGHEIVEAAAEEDADDEAQPSEGYDAMLEDETDPEAAAERRALAEAAAREEEAARAAAEAEERAAQQERLRRVALALMRPSTEVVDNHTAPPEPMSFDEAEGAVDLARARAGRRREAVTEPTTERAPAKTPRTSRPRLTMRGAERDAAAGKSADEGLASEG